jgi:hypothetical protein
VTKPDQDLSVLQVTILQLVVVERDAGSLVGHVWSLQNYFSRIVLLITLCTLISSMYQQF